MTRTIRAALAVGACFALLLTACSSGNGSDDADTGARGKKPSGTIKLVYLQKQGDQQYFIDEADGAKKKASELGVDLKVVNLGEDANKTITETQTAIAQNADGIIVVVPDPGVGPQVVSLAKDAKVGLLASDDQICVNNSDPTKCKKDSLVPRIGFNGSQMGAQVGQSAGELFKTAGWKPDETRVIAAWDPDVTVCGDRVKAAKQSFESTSGQKVEVIEVGTDNTPTDAQDKVSAKLSANRSVKHWVVWGCNDENVSGAVTALQNGGVSANNIIGVGLGAYLACKDWNSGKPTGVKSALFINGYEVGQLAVQKLYDYLRKGTELPREAFANTSMVNSDNWRQSGLKCS